VPGGAGESRQLNPPKQRACRPVLTATPVPATASPRLQLEPNPRAYKWWQEQELKDLCNTVGLLDFRRARSNRFILFSATKPAGSAQ
jgi:hypothetical protein